MKTRTKALLLALCAVALVAATVFGTIAFLTDTEKVANTFTVGSVGITLDEAKVNPTTGKGVDKEGNDVEDYTQAVRVNGVPSGGSTNSYHLLPGHSYVKDPTVTVVAGSEESYVRMMVTVTFAESITDQLGTDLSTIFTGYDARWVRTGYTPAADGTSITYEYRYQADDNTATVAKSETATKLPALFTGITVPQDLTNEQLAVFAGMKIDIVAHAIQSDGFSDANAAWTAFGEQANPKP